MFELIKRQIKAEKITLPQEYDEVQVAVNDWGHLTIRFLNAEEQNKDAIIVFDSLTTAKIMRFLKKIAFI